MKPKFERFVDAIRSERATSPTIGAVLLVGVTVMLATTAGAGMFGLAEESRQGAFATATIDHSPTDDQVSVRWVANANADRLEVTVRVDDRSRTVTLQSVGDGVVVDADGVTVRKGEVVKWDRPSVVDDDRVSVTVVAVKGGERTVVAERSAQI